MLRLSLGAQSLSHSTPHLPSDVSMAMVLVMVIVMMMVMVMRTIMVMLMTWLSVLIVAAMLLFAQSQLTVRLVLSSALWLMISTAFVRLKLVGSVLSKRVELYWMTERLLVLTLRLNIAIRNHKPTPSGVGFFYSLV